MTVLFQKLNPAACLPRRATLGSAGYDLCACIEQPLTVKPGQTVPVPTGLAMALPKGYGGFVFARSGLGIRHGVVPGNCVGVIDADYRGEVLVGLHNHSDTAYTIQPGERIAQLVSAQLFEKSDWNVVSYSVDGTGSRQTTYSMPGRSVYVMVPDQSTVDHAKELLRQVQAGEILTQE